MTRTRADEGSLTRFTPRGTSRKKCNLLDNTAFVAAGKAEEDKRDPQDATRYHDITINLEAEMGKRITVSTD